MVSKRSAFVTAAMRRYRQRLKDKGGNTVSIALDAPAYAALLCICEDYGMSKKSAVTKLLIDWAESQPDGLPSAKTRAKKLIKKAKKA